MTYLKVGINRAECRKMTTGNKYIIYYFSDVNICFKLKFYMMIAFELMDAAKG
jgi:hypothetical protein